MNSVCRAVVLISGTGSNFAALHRAAADPDYGLRILAVGSDRPDAPGLELAREAGLATFTCSPEDFPDRDAWDRAVAAAVGVFDPDLVVCAGFMRVLGPAFLRRFEGRTVNTHPALLPAFPGAHAVRDALAAGVGETGATVHLVDAGVDTGPVLAQVRVPVLPDDDETTLHERIKQVERDQLVATVGALARGEMSLTPGAEAPAADQSPAADGEAPAADDQAASQGPAVAEATPQESPDADVEAAGASAGPAAGDAAAGRPADLDRLPEEPRPDGLRPVRRALVSVWDKTGLVDLARGLHEAGVAIVSTGSTAAAIQAAGLPVQRVEDLTGFPECLDGRVKTLHPRVHAGILADRRLPDHVRQLDALGIEPFDLVVVNLYPFTATVTSGAGPDQCVELIDIGGPSMVRAAAKNHACVAVVVDPAGYDAAVQAVGRGGFTLAERRTLAAAAFAHTAAYDVAVAGWFAERSADAGWEDGLDATGAGAAGAGQTHAEPVAGGRTEAAPSADEVASSAVEPPAWRGASRRLVATLRYGENPHQRAALYADDAVAAGAWPGVAGARQLGGKEMSYNNYVDADAALRAAYDFDEPACAVVKHSNPCGIAIGSDVLQAHARAHACDPLSAYGGVIAVNRPVDPALARQIRPVFTEVILAPAYDPEALEVLRGRKNLRILAVEAPVPGAWETRPISGGLLAQTPDRIDAPGDAPAGWRLVAGPGADAATLADLVFAWRAVRSVKSNAILLACGGASVGIGMGQVNRVDSAHLAVRRAGAERVRGSVGASDAYFPFPDGLEVLTGAGVRAVVQPGGSIRDEEVIAAAQAAGTTMYLTGVRHFFH